MMKKKMIACAVMACALAANMVAPAMAASWTSIPAAYNASGDTADVPIIMPYTSIGRNDVRASGSYESSAANAENGKGKYIQYYYRNDSDYDCTVMLEKKTGLLGNWKTVSSMKVGAGKRKTELYTSDSEKGTYRVCIEAKDGGDITGEYNIAQYKNEP